MEPSVENLFSVEAMVCGYHKYFRAGVKFHMGPLSFACYHHQTSNPEVCLCTCWQKKYPKIVFSHSTLPVVLNLKYFNNTITAPLTHTHTAYILITNFLKKKLDKKILAILFQFAKFSPSKILYRTVLKLSHTLK